MFKLRSSILISHIIRPFIKIKLFNFKMETLFEKQDQTDSTVNKTESQEKKKKILKFVSGNSKKFEEIKAILKLHLPDVEVIQVKIDLPELQGEPDEIVKDKLKIALEKAEGPLIVEDTSLCFSALNGLPGPYIKAFLTKLGPNGLYKMVGSYKDHSAYAMCIMGLAKTRDDEANLFVGKTQGEIVEPRGPHNFGWDPVFQPHGFDKTYAELDSDVKNTISHRYKALNGLLEFLQANPKYL